MKCATAQIFAFFLAILYCLSCNLGPKDPGQLVETSSEDTIRYGTYVNSTYHFNMRKPDKWTLAEKESPIGEGHAISMYPAGRKVEGELPLNVHHQPDLSYISIWPRGLGTELPPGMARSFAAAKDSLPHLQFDFDPQRSKVFYLRDSTPWAFFVVPATPPASWTNDGFIFVQYGVDNFEAKCYQKDNRAAKSLEDCNPLEGDIYEREGSIRVEEAVELADILENIVFTTVGQQTSASVPNIEIHEPQPNAAVQSPLKIQGEATGTWFFEASFPVLLYGPDGKLLAQVPAQAQGEWMTESLVPFQASLDFNAPDKGEGKLVFKRANPSGHPENDREFSVPVRFEP